MVFTNLIDCNTNDDDKQGGHIMSEVKDAWEIMTEDDADWAIRKIAECDAEDAKWEQFYKAQLQSIKDKNAERKAFFMGHLQRYFETLPHKVTKTQESYDLPSGKLIMKKQQPEYTRDDDALCLWAAENGMAGFIKVKQSIDWASMKKAIASYPVIDGRVADPNTGELIDGLTVEQREPKFVIE